ncbi:MAG: hypothetical protein PWP46_197 [Fusobacteriaceae bacterium]|nr:hypothetical protein [Fusobacteriaceae bacterium]
MRSEKNKIAHFQRRLDFLDKCVTRRIQRIEKSEPQRKNLEVLSIFLRVLCITKNSSSFVQFVTKNLVVLKFN